MSENSKIKFKPAVLELLGDTLKNRLIDVKCVIREVTQQIVNNGILGVEELRRVLARIERNTRPQPKRPRKIRHSIQPLNVKR